MKLFKKIIKKRWVQIILTIIIFLLLIWYWPQKQIKPDYGFTFSEKYARELRLNPHETLEKIFLELNLRKVRLIAYWDDIQKDEENLDFSVLDWQIEMAKKYNAEIILVVGKRVPRWPECHIPYWALNLKKEIQEEKLLNFIEEVVKRYKDDGAIKVWQVENEPFLTGFAKQYCGVFDKKFLEKEIDLVRQLDSETPILLTDSGELSLWTKAYKRADHFGSTFYVYVANEFFEDVRSFMSHNFYRYKLFLMKLFYGEKPSYFIEVSIEPWLTKPIIQTSFGEQLQKMNVKRAEIILRIASQAGFTEQYLWGPEWWYYLKKNGHPELWDYFSNLHN
jgi:hypothetical protein